jgi:hypothetical protein
MEYLLPIIAAVVAVVLIFLVIKVISGVFRIIGYVLLIMVIITGIFSFLLINETMSISQGTKDKPSVFLIQEEEKLVSGFTVNVMNLSTAKALSTKDIDKAQEYLDDEDMKSILGDGFRLIIIDTQAFPKNDKFNPDTVMAYVKGENKYSWLLDDLKPASFPDTKTSAFAVLVALSIKQDPTFLLKGYRAGTIIIYPDSLVFKIMKTFSKQNKTGEKE